MRSITVTMAGFKPQTFSGEELYFENAKGGYLSTDENYALKVTGKMSQNGKPTANSPIPIDCVKAGTVIYSDEGSSITVPCDLYLGDVWYPALGKVIKNTNTMVLTGDESIDLGGVYDGNPYFYISITNPEAFHSGYGAPFLSNMAWNVYAMYMDGTIMYIFTESNGFSQNVDEFKALLKNRYSEGNPMILVYEMKNKRVEYYDVQNISGKSILQSPTGLAAELSAIALVRR